MSGEATRVTVRILDRDYHVACPPEERSALVQSAELLDRKMREIRSTGKVVGLDRIAVMAALNMAHDLLEQDNTSQIADRIGQRIRLISNKLDAALSA